MSSSQHSDDHSPEHEALLLPRRPVRRILMPTDFSAESLEALGVASELARATGAELHFLWIDVLGATRPEERRFPTHEHTLKASWRAAPPKIHERAAEHDLQIVTAEERAVEVGPGIALYAYENQIDLIVMATAGRSGIAKFFMGSVAEQVVRYAPCSVLVLAPGAKDHEAGDPPRILTAIDFSETSLEAARLAHELSDGLGAEHTVLHVVSSPPVPTFYGLEQTMTPQVMEEILDRSRQELSRFVDESLPGADWRVATGGTVSTIRHEIDDSSADLLVVGSHGLTGLPRLLLGSVAEKLVRTVHVPILVVRPRGTVPAEPLADDN